MAADEIETAERLARIEWMLEQHRETKQRQLLRRAMKLWRRAEAHQQLMNLERPPARVH